MKIKPEDRDGIELAFNIVETQLKPMRARLEELTKLNLTPRVRHYIRSARDTLDFTKAEIDQVRFDNNLKTF